MTGRGSAVSAVDIGTNSTRLLVVGADGRQISRRTTITRLGQGVDGNRRLATEAMERTCRALMDYRVEWEAAGASPPRIVATSAARDATNREQFFDMAENACGVRPELISGTTEAGLAFAGATTGLGVNGGPYLVVDIGGGSTEFILGRGEPGEALRSLSVDIGSVRLTERELVSDPPRPEELSNALAIVEAHLADVERAIPEVLSYRRLIGVAGTITTAAAVEIGMSTYDPDRIHHFVLTRNAAEDVFRTLATESLADRIHNPGLARERADVIVGGCCIVVGIMRWLKADEMLVSEFDLLDGLARSLHADNT